MSRRLAVTVVLSIAAPLAALAAACGSSGSTSSGTAGDAGSSSEAAASSCTAKISGSTTTTMTCFAQAGSSSADHFFSIYGFDGSQVLTVFITLADEPQATTYTPANVETAGGLFSPQTDGGGPRWMFASGADATPAGTFSLDVTDIGPSHPGAAGSHVDQVWSAPHGTFTGTYDATPGSGATGSLTIDITF